MLRPQFGDLMCCTVQGLVDLAALRLAANNMGLTANMTRKHPNIPETSPEETWPSRPRGPRVLLKDEFEGALVSHFRCPGCPLFAFCCLPYHRPSKSKDGARSQFYEEASRHRPCAPHPVIEQQKSTCYFEQGFVRGLPAQTTPLPQRSSYTLAPMHSAASRSTTPSRRPENP